MDISLSLPLDQGFLRRECPHCKRQFKWHHGPTGARSENAVDPAVYYCPYCGGTAPIDEWWTKEQIEYAQRLALGKSMRLFNEGFKEIERHVQSGMIQIKHQETDPEPPLPVYEPEDMVIVLAPCHPWEPIKIDETWAQPLHCLICGAEFAIG
jgi:hypothetical protein